MKSNLTLSCLGLEAAWEDKTPNGTVCLEGKNNGAKRRSSTKHFLTFHSCNFPV